MAIFYPFSDQLPVWQVLGATLLILVISAAVIAAAKRLPSLFVGWLWFAITILPVIGIFQISLAAPYAMADRYYYLPSIGIAVILAWGIPFLIKREDTRKKILSPVSIAALSIMAVLTWQQCGYWKNSITIFTHTLQVTKNNFFAHNQRGADYDKLGQYQLAIEDYNEAIPLKPDLAETYNRRGNVYDKLGQYQSAIEDYNEAIRLKPDLVGAYNNRGNLYDKLGQYQLAIEDYNEAIRLKPDLVGAYNNRGNVYDKLGHYQLAIKDYNEAIRLKPDLALGYNNRGNVYNKLGQYQFAIEDYNEAIRLKPDLALAYNNRGLAYLAQGNKKLGCFNAQMSCAMGVCKTLELAKSNGYCL